MEKGDAPILIIDNIDALAKAVRRLLKFTDIKLTNFVICIFRLKFQIHSLNLKPRMSKNVAYEQY